MKDNFSSIAGTYAKFRPGYPEGLVAELVSHVPVKQNALDCGTGNGQFAVLLAKYFERVYATDMSDKQIENAQQHEKIIYSVQPAEHTNFADHTFDLVTVAQAIHWFDFDKFYAEVKRILKPDGIIAAITYGLVRINKEINEVINTLYVDITGPYWDPERKYVDEAYKTIPFPFEEIPFNIYKVRQQWTADHLIGFLNTWSGVSHYKKAKGENPVNLIEAEIRRLWKDDVKEVRFPFFARVGKNNR